MAINILERKSQIYSDRPTLVMGSKLCGYDRTLILMPYGSRFRASRRLMHQFMGTKSSVEKFAEVEEEETRRMMSRILKDPDSASLPAHVRK